MDLQKKQFIVLAMLFFCGNLLATEKKSEILSLIGMGIKHGPFVLSDYRCVSLGVKNIDGRVGEHAHVTLLQNIGFTAFPLLKEQAFINYESKQQSPLNGKTITNIMPLHLGVFGVLAQENPASLYLVHGVDKNEAALQRVFIIKDLLDAQGQQATKIVGIEPAALKLHRRVVSAVFCPVAPAGGAWGSAGSGMQVVYLDEPEPEPEKKDEKVELVLQNRAEWRLLGESQTKEQSTVPYAAAINWSDVGVSINDGLDVVSSDHVCLHWSKDLERLYVGLQVTTKKECSENQGASSLFVGRMVGEQLQFSPILPEAPLGAPGVLAATGAMQSASVWKMADMITSTRALYLVMVGGVGQSEETERMVFALPLTSTGYLRTGTGTFEDVTSIKHGVIARDAAEVEVVPVSSGADRNIVHARLVREPQKAEDQPYTPQDPAIVVGGGKAPGPVSHILAQEDAVLISVAQGDFPGIYHSRALFDGSGKIVSWTPWKRVGGIRTPVYAFALHVRDNNFFYLTDHPTDSDHYFLRKTEWEELSVDCQLKFPWSQLLLFEKIFSMVEDTSVGIQSVFELQTSSAESEDYDGQHSVIAVLAPEQVVLAARTPTGFAATPFCGMSFLKEKGLSELGPLSSIALIKNDGQAWLAVGGAYGIAILADQDGHGFSTDLSASAQLVQIAEKNMQFTKIGDWKFVNKFISQNGVLYAISDDALIRLTVSPVEKGFAVTYDVLADARVVGKIYDGVIDGPLAFLATTKGLFSNNEGSSVRGAATDVPWNVITIPNFSGAVFRLSLTRSVLGGMGMIIALAPDFVKGSTSLYRFSINGLDNDVVTPRAIQLIPEVVYGTRPWLAFNGIRTLFYSDGCEHLLAHGSRAGSGSAAYILPQEHRTIACSKIGVCYKTKRSSDAENDDVVAIMHSSVLGELVVVGNRSMQTVC